MGKILSFDQQLFLRVNQGLGSEWLDPFMRFVSSRSVFFCLLLALVLVCIHRRAWKILALIAVMGIGVGVVDPLAYHFLKPFFARLRPCHALPDLVRLVDGCGGQWGFPSNHAANSMTVATFCYLYLSRPWVVAAFSLALIIGFSRIYLGVHYPLDVLFGFTVGFAVALIVDVTLKPIAAPYLPARNN